MKTFDFKRFTINPQTSSPEILLTVARVVNITPKSTQNIVIRYLRCPGASQAALAFGLCGAVGFDDEEQVGNDEETLEWADFLENALSRAEYLSFSKCLMASRYEEPRWEKNS